MEAIAYPIDRDNASRKLVNNTGADTQAWDAAFLAAVDNGGQLPEELADLFAVIVLEDSNGRWGVIVWVEDEAQRREELAEEVRTFWDAC